MKKSLATILVSALGLGLMVYTAYRGYSFISLTLPPDKQFLGIFALLALDAGLLFWLACFLYAAEGGFQRAVSLIMVIVDLIGSVFLAAVDALLTTGATGLTVQLSADFVYAAVLAMSGVIALNVASVVLFHLWEPGNQKRMAEQEAFDAIESEALSAISHNAKGLAAELAPRLAADWMLETRERYLAKVKHSFNDGHDQEEAEALKAAVPFGKGEK